jgi:hypothetical protein
MVMKEIDQRFQAEARSGYKTSRSSDQRKEKKIINRKEDNKEYDSFSCNKTEKRRNEGWKLRDPR